MIVLHLSKYSFKLYIMLGYITHQIRSVDAFDNAINAGFLSPDPQSDVYAGRYMYMYSIGKINYFKNVNTREYSSFVTV